MQKEGRLAPFSLITPFSMMVHRSYRSIILLFGLCCAACSGPLTVGERDGGLLARESGPQRADYDECGNGMDDDADGQIDESCTCFADETQLCFSGTYPHRLIGACTDGRQLCNTAGTGPGIWGACGGDTLPSTETCDGIIDEDCDGALDEGCPCDASESRPCAQSFSAGPCSPGTQLCRQDGAWSQCLGAVGPSAELCSDVLDNDCDGVINEGCECLSEPEACGDGRDNDCDGEVDELACDSDPTWVSEGRVSTDPDGHRAPFYGDSATGIAVYAAQSSGTLAALSASGLDGVNVDLWRPDGTLLAQVPLNSDGGKVDLSLDSEGFLASYDVVDSGGSGQVHVVRLSAEGGILIRRNVATGRGVGALRIGDTIAVSWTADVRHLLGFFDLNLVSLGAAIDLGPSPRYYRMQAAGGAGAIISSADSATEAKLTLIRGRDVLSVALPGSGVNHFYRVIEESDDSFLVCWSADDVDDSAECQRIRISDAALMGRPFPAPSMLGVRTSSGLVFASSAEPNRPRYKERSHEYSLHRLSAETVFTSQTVAWDYHTELVDFLASAGGGVRMLLRGSRPGVLVAPVTLGFARDLPPLVDDCERARELACQEVSACCEGIELCDILAGGIPVTAADPCPLPPTFCVQQGPQCLQDLLAGASFCRYLVGLTDMTIALPLSCTYQD